MEYAMSEESAPYVVGSEDDGDPEDAADYKAGKKLAEALYREIKDAETVLQNLNRIKSILMEMSPELFTPTGDFLLESVGVAE